MINGRREVEAKFYLGKDLNYSMAMKKKLADAGFIYVGARIETDFLPDTAKEDCKNHHLLFRIREVVTKDNQSMLITVKLRKPAENFIDFQEFETSFPHPETQTFEQIRAMLKEATGIAPDYAITKAASLADAKQILVKQGYTKSRIHLDKFRKIFRLGKIIATIDLFPDGMGLFLELESHSPNDLRRIIDLLKLDKSTIITDDYGDLLKQHKIGLTSKEQRKAVFSRAQSARLLAECV